MVVVVVVVVGIVVDLSVFSEIISEEGGQKSWKYFCLRAFKNLMAFYDN